MQINQQIYKFGRIADQSKKGRTDITNIILETIEDFSISPFEINNGNCDNFACAVCRQIKTAEFFETTLESDFPVHCFIKFKGLFYDAETPKGVKNWKNLPIFS